MDLEIRHTTTRVSGPWLVAGIEWFRPLLGGYVDSTDSPAQTDGRTLPPERPRWESNPRPPTCKSRRALPTELVGRVPTLTKYAHSKVKVIPAYFIYRRCPLPATADQLLLTRLEDRVRDGHGGHGLEHVGHQPCVPKSKTRRHRLRSAGSPETSLSARSCLRLPELRPASAYQPLGPRWPALQAFIST